MIIKLLNSLVDNRNGGGYVWHPFITYLIMTMEAMPMLQLLTYGQDENT